MAALTENRDTKRQNGDLVAVPMGVDIVYRGGMVIRSADGYCDAGADTADVDFEGVAFEKKDNSAGANGDLNVRVYKTGMFSFACSGMAITDVGKAAYLSDDQTITLVPNNVWVGIIQKFVSATEVFVDIEPAARHAGSTLKTVTASITTFVGTIHELLYTCPTGMQATVISAQFTPMTVPVYATSCLFNLFKYDLSGTSLETAQETADTTLHSLTAFNSTDVGLETTAPTQLDLEDGDQLIGRVVSVGSETTAGHIGISAQIRESRG